MGAVPFRKEMINTRKRFRYGRSSSASFDIFEEMGPTSPAEKHAQDSSYQRGCDFLTYFLRGDHPERPS
jgi:hypothetical protein